MHRSGASADRRKLKAKENGTLCRDAATKSFQRDLSRRNGLSRQNPMKAEVKTDQFCVASKQLPITMKKETREQ